MAKRKANLSVPIKWGAPEKRFGESIKENLDILIGHRGNPIDRAVTFKDLLDTKVLSLAGNASLSTAGDDPANYTVPSEGNTNVQFPPAPTSLAASGAFQNVVLTWDLNNYVGHSHVEIHRHTSDSISSATLVAQVSGFTGIYSDAVGSSANFYYWVRAVNVNNEIGPFNSSTGVNGTTQPDLTIIMDLLANQITSSELAQSLASPIAQIPTIDSLLSSIETYTGYTSSYSGNNLLSRISTTETTATLANTLAGNLETFTGYLSSYSGNSLLSRIGSAETTVSGHTTSIGTINSSITSINSSITSLNTATSNLQTSLSDLSANTADVYIQATAPTGTIAANSRWYDTSDNNELHIYFDSDGNGTSEWVEVSDPRVESNETDIAALETEVFNTDGSSRLATASALSNLNTTVVNQGSSITSLTTDVTSLKNEVFDSNGGSLLATAAALSTTNTTVSNQGTSISSLQTDVTALDGAVFNADNSLKLATTSALNTLTSDVRAIYDGTNPSIVKTIQADVTSLEGEVFNTDGTARLATGSALNTLTNTVTTQGNTLGTAQGDITTLEGAVFNSDGTVKLATTTSVTALTNTVNTQGGNISTLQGDVTDLEAEVFNSDGSGRLATGSALTTLSNTVSTQGSSISTVQNDVTTLEGAVFDSSGNVKLATTSALGGLTNTVEAIYDGTNPSVVKTIQTDVTSLESEVFNSNGTGRLATASALSGLSSTVSSQGGSITTLQTDVTDLESQVFNNDGTARLATASALSGVSSSVSTNSSNITTIQSDVTALEGEVFNSDGTSRLATGSALTSLSNDVSAIYDSSSNSTIVGSIQSDVTSLQGAVFDSNGAVQLASSSAVTLLNNEVWGNGVTPSGATSSRIDSLNSAITNPSTGLTALSGALSTLNTEVFPNGTASASRIDTLDTAVFDSNGTVKLATAQAVSALETEVYGSSGASASRIDGLYTAIYDSNGNFEFATASAFNTLNTAVTGTGAIADKVDNIAASMFVNGDTTGTLQLATSSALNTVTTEVFPNGTTSASSIDTLQSAVFDSSGAVKLASATALNNLETEVFGSGGASASRIDGLVTEVFNGDGSSRLATASALTTLNTQVNGSGAISDKVDDIAAAMFVAGNTEGTLNLATASAVNTLTSEVFPDGTTSASRLDTLDASVFNSDGTVKLASATSVSDLQTEVYGTGGAGASRIDGLFSEVFNSDGSGRLATAANLQTVTTEVFPDGTGNASRIDNLATAVFDSSGNVQLASAQVVSDLTTEVFPNGAANASAIDTVSATVSGQTSSIQTLQTVVGDANGGLSSQYSVKLDNNGHVAGFGLSNTDNDGTPTSAFIIRADKFSIVAPTASNQQTNSPSNSSDLIVPFVVQAAQTTINGETVPAGVYMDTAFIKNGSIETAKIGSLTVDKITGTMAQFEQAITGTISTSRLNIDNTTLTSGPNGELQVDSLNANAITGGVIGANVMIGTSVYADKLVGDVAVLNPFRSTSTVVIRGNAASGGGTVQVTSQQLPATTHLTNGHKPFASVTGWYDSTANKTYRFRMYMKDNAGGQSSLGQPVSASSYYGTHIIQFNGNITSSVSSGDTLYATGKQHTVTSVTYISSSNNTSIQYTLSSGGAFTTSDTVSVGSGSSWQLVGETRFKANTNLYAQFAVSGSLSNKTTGTVDMKVEVTRTGSSGITDNDTSTNADYLYEISGFMMGAR